MVLYRGKYNLAGLKEIPPDMLRDLDLAYDVCQTLKDNYPCEMCGRCCHQPHIAVRAEEIDSVSCAAGIDLFTFATQYIVSTEEEGVWHFRKTNPCAFLNEDCRCRIWKGRPEVCDEFPYMVSMFMSRVYLAIVNDVDIIDLVDYMDDTWPCTRIIKDKTPALIEEAKKKRASLHGVPK